MVTIVFSLVFQYPITSAQDLVSSLFIAAAALYPELEVRLYFALPVMNLLGLAAALAQFSQVLFDKSLYNLAQAKNADGHVILATVVA